MPLPRAVARFNRLVLNRILGPLTRFLPYFATLTHTGRKSHRQYSNPIMVFPRPGGYTIALTYGPATDWVRNVLASGDCLLTLRGRTIRLVQPRLVHDPRRRAMPPIVRFILGLIGVNDFLELSPAGSQTPERAATNSVSGAEPAPPGTGAAPMADRAGQRSGAAEAVVGRAER